jgi:hypothetical protein
VDKKAAGCAQGEPVPPLHIVGGTEGGVEYNTGDSSEEALRTSD